MNLDRLYEILRVTTIQLRKGEVVRETVTPGLVVTTIDAMPHENEAGPEIEKIDLHFLTVGVDTARALTYRQELVTMLEEWRPMLAEGPSYLTVGANIGNQGAAFQLFALGKALGFWGIITPAAFHLEGTLADDAAGAGFIMIDGFRP